MKEFKAGLPQGSVLSPILWNILYEGVLRLQLEESAETIAFADDLAVIVRGLNKEDLMNVGNGSLIVIGRRNRPNIVFRMGDTRINNKKTVKCLG